MDYCKQNKLQSEKNRTPLYSALMKGLICYLAIKYLAIKATVWVVWRKYTKAH